MIFDYPADMNIPPETNKPSITININETNKHSGESSNNASQITKIFLTDDNNSWLSISQLPEDLINYTNENYNSLFDLHPPELGKILFYDKQDWKEIVKNRYHASYLNTPKYNKNVLSSFMFSGYDESKNNDDIPSEFKPFYDFIKLQNDKYNQIGINWYDACSYIPFHSDCEAGMIENHEITIINLNNPKQTNSNELLDERFEERILTFKPRGDKKNNLYDNVNICLSQGVIVTMNGNTQNDYKHGIKPLKNGNVISRIGVSFRQF